MSEQLVVVLCTCPDHQQAMTLANTLVRERLAACVNILPGVVSVYQWQDSLEQEEEVQLLIKTPLRRFDELSQRIRQLHSYDEPEIVALDVKAASQGYAGWVSDVTQD